MFHFRKYSVPEGTLNIQLCTDEKSEHALENGKYCEILGETIIINPQGETKTFETIPLTSRGLVEQMQYITESNSKEKLLSYYKENYKPAINVWFTKQISSAADLISRNLEIRLLEQAVESL